MAVVRGLAEPRVPREANVLVRSPSPVQSRRSKSTSAPGDARTAYLISTSLPAAMASTARVDVSQVPFAQTAESAEIAEKL